MPQTLEALNHARAAKVPVLVAVNKVDHRSAESGVVDFAVLGFEKLFPVSAIHGEGIQALMDAAVGHRAPGDAGHALQGRTRCDH